MTEFQPGDRVRFKTAPEWNKALLGYTATVLSHIQGLHQGTRWYEVQLDKPVPDYGPPITYRCLPEPQHLELIASRGESSHTQWSQE